MATPSVLDRVRLAYRTFLQPRAGAWEYLMSDYGRGSTAGISVSEQSALRFSPVWAGVSILSRDIAKLPLVLYKNLPNGGKERFTSHPLYRILHDEANPEMSSFKFRETMQALTILWGNGYAEIVRDAAGRVQGMYPIAPHRVSAIRDDQSGQLLYRVQNPSGRQSLIAPRSMIHLSALSLDGILGESIAHHGAESIGLGIAAEKFGGSFFGNGATFGGIVEYPSPLKAEDKVAIRESIEAVHQGVERAHKILVLAGGAKFTERGTAPDNAQFLETRKFQVEEVARWLTMPPHKLANLENAHFTNIEEEEIGYHTNTLGGWLQMWEQELRRKLIAPLEYTQQSIGHVMQAVMRGNSTQRADFYTKMFMIGAMSPNDILRLEDMNPIGPKGDVHMVQLNMIPLERYGEYIDATLAAKAPAGELAPAPPDGPENEDTVAERAIREHLQALTQRAEQGAVTTATLETRLEATTSQLARLTEEAAHQRSIAASAHADVSTRQVLLDRVAADLESATRELTILREDATRQQHDVEEARAAVAAKQAVLERLDADLTIEREARRSVDDARQAQSLALEQTAAAKAAAETTSQALTETLAQREQDLEAATDALRNAQEQLALTNHKLTAAGEDRAAIQLRVDEATASLAVKEAALASAARDIAAVRAQQEEFETRAIASAEALRVAEQQLAVVTTERAAERAAAQAAMDHALATTAAHEEALRQTADALAAARTAITEIETRAAATATALHDTTAARTRSEREYRSAMLMAVRDVLHDAYARIARTEVERARKRSANPQVLKRWAEAFYDEHGRDVCAEILRPAAKAYLAWSRSDEDPRTVARSWSDAYCDHSARQLIALADGMDGEEFQTAVQRLIGSWEQERPQMVAEKVLTDALQSLQ